MAGKVMAMSRKEIFNVEDTKALLRKIQKEISLSNHHRFRPVFAGFSFSYPHLLIFPSSGRLA
jgi:hypothetical protein